MENKKQALERKKHLFQVELLVEEPTHTLALAALLQALNHPAIKDFRITQGIQFGQIIEKTIKENKAQPFPITAPPKTSKKPAAEEKRKISLDQLLELKERGNLVRLIAVKDKGVRLSIPCRILNFDPDMQNLTIYHVDEKKVYLFNLNEIEDILF